MGLDDLRILIAGRDPLVRAGLRALLSAEPGCEVVAAIGIDLSDTAVPMAAAPDVILADADGDTEFGEAVSALASFGVPVLALLPTAAWTSAALAAGARGSMVRTAAGERLAAALRAVAAGLQVSEPSERGRDEEPFERTADPPLEELTPREGEVLQLLAEGLSNKAIARRLRISEHTVKFHVTAIMGKLATHSRTETVARAARAGLIVL